MAADDEKVAQCVAYYRKLLDARPKTPESLQQATRSGLQQIIHRAGAKRRTDVLLARLDEAFAEKGIVTRPRLTDPKNRPDERIYMFDRRHQLKGLSKLTRQSFPDENSLRQFILANLHEFDELRGLTVVEKEKRQTSGRRFDLLCKRPRRNQLVAIELKLKAADYRTVGQSLQYIDDLIIEADKQGCSPHFILIAGGQPNPAAHDQIQDYAEARGVGVTFLLHRVEMSLRLHP
ncbi:endonuclease NucS domain-containing protein [Mycobacterium sp. E3198]|uniref:endonuclease NucS domain-containing protein n=1 Tax=Mycobacterium sp. E3198 TaxID=1834143 RepID=UPI0018D3D911|nr:endonuclease NucS domain-containing protein [Mycobacterium sp. E3198]